MPSGPAPGDAYELFTSMDAPAFAHRAEVELAATGVRVQKHAPGQAGDRPREAQARCRGPLFS